MEIKIEPYQRIGPLTFGMSQTDARSALQAEYRSFKKAPNAEFPTDEFPSLGMHIYYKKPGVIEAVELFKPSSPQINEVSILGGTFRDVVNQIEKFDPQLEFDEDGFTSKKLGIGIYAPGAQDDPGLEVEGVIVFEKGYYD